MEYMNGKDLCVEINIFLLITRLTVQIWQENNHCT